MHRPVPDQPVGRGHVRVHLIPDHRVRQGGPRTTQRALLRVPRHHPDREGRPHRYSYYNTCHRLGTMFDAVTRLDLADNTVESSMRRTIPATASASRCSHCGPGSRRGRRLVADGGVPGRHPYLTTGDLDARDPARGPVGTAALTHHIPQDSTATSSRADLPSVASHRSSSRYAPAARKREEDVVFGVGHRHDVLAVADTPGPFRDVVDIEHRVATLHRLGAGRLSDAVVGALG